MSRLAILALLLGIAAGAGCAFAGGASVVQADLPPLPVPPSALRSAPVVDHPPERWIAMGEQVHGGFGVLIAVGIRIGRDALARLGAVRRELDVTYQQGAGTPCPCVVDGILLATSASPGQGSLRVSPRPATAGWHGEVLVRRRRDGAGLRYCIAADAVAALEPAQASGDPQQRWAATMALPFDRLARVIAADQPCPPLAPSPANPR